MGTITRARFLTGAFCLSLCGLGVSVSMSLRAQTSGDTRPAPSASCGNAKIEGVEQCDDGNRKPGDGCNSACKKETCGDGVVTPSLGEECDTKQLPTNREQPYEGCDASCKLSYCGDGVVQSELKEQCDDRNGVSGDGCSALCQKEQGISTCSDTDGGMRTDVAGTVSGTFNGSAYTASDMCEGTGVVEYYCNGVSAARVLEKCANGCENGACKKAPVACRIPLSTGSAMQNQTQPHDVDGNGVVNEIDTQAATSAFNAINEGRTVPATLKPDVDGNGKIDINDILQLVYYVNCMKPKVSCADTDGGNKPDVFGTVTVVENGQTTTKTDVCIPSTTGKTLSEYSCEGSMAMATTVECPNGCENGACKKAADSRCAVVTPKGKAMQNQKNPTDVNDDGKTDFWDVRAIYGYYNEEPIGAKTAAKPYMNVDGSTNLLGRETFDIQDILYVVNNVNYCNLPAEKKLNLASVTMGCEANVNVAKVAYDKNFEGCAHVVSADGKRLDSQNVLCPNAGPISIPLAKLAISSNQSVKICDATDYSKCSQPVTVTGSPCGALPPSITLGNAVISCNAENKTIFTVNYQATNVNSNFLHLVDEQLKLRHTTNLFLSNQVQTSAPIGSFIDIAPALKLKLCTTNYGTCSSVIEVSGKGCDTTTPSPITLTSASFSCTSTFATSATIAYAAKDASKLVLMLDNGSWLYNGADITGGKTSATVTTFENVPVPAGSSVKLCDSVNRALCSSAVTVAGAGCSKNISLAGVALTVNGGVPSAKVAYTKDSFPTCLHMFIASDKSKALHSVNYFCSTTGETKTVPLGPTAGNQNDGLKVKEGDSVVLCHGNNANICSMPVTVTKEATPVATTLSIATKSIGSSDTSVRNEKNVTLLRFEARAGNGDAVLTNVIARASAGNLQNAQNYSMWVDTDGDSVTDYIIGRTTPSENLLKFNPIHVEGVLIKKDTPLLFEIRADIASSPVSNQIQLDLATSTANYVSAQTTFGNIPLVGIKTNGMCEGTCAITVTTVPSILHTITSQGNLFVTLDSTPTRSRQLLAGTLGDSILRLQFRAEHEKVDVTDLQLTSRGSRATSIDSLELYKDGSPTPFAVATASGCGADQVVLTDRGIPVTTFCANMNNRELVVNDGENLDVLVKARIKNDNSGGVSGEAIQLFVSPRAISNDATGEGAVRARGTVSSNNLAANDNDAANEGEIFIGTENGATNVEIAGNMNTVVLSKIVSITNANPDADNSSVPTGVSPIGQFKFAAAPHQNQAYGFNKATLNSITFNVALANASIDATSYKFYNKADSSKKKSCTVTSGGGNAGNTSTATTSHVVTCADVHLPVGNGEPIDTEVGQGESRTFVLEANVTNPKTVPTANSSLEVSLQNFSAPYPAASNILWTDKDAVGTIQYKWIEYSDTVVRSTYYKS